MKAYSFYFNTSDWLASPAVKMMSKAERGVYIGLLASAWESPVQGTLPASVDKVRRLAEMSLDEWAESGETLLEKFPLSECGTYRYNPRLLAEAAKEQARSDKAKKSADMRWQSERNANASKTDANASKKVCLDDAQVKLSKVVGKPTNADSAAPSSAAVDLKAIKEKEKELDFISFWLPYYGDLPKRGSKADAKKQWLALSAATRALILTGLEAHRAEATRNGPDYLPYATTFLGQQRWKWDTFGTVSPTNALPSQPTARQDFPQPGHEQAGQVFYIAGRPGDYNMDKMAAESCLIHFPSAKVVSLAFPQVPYSMQDGNVIRK